MPWRTSPTSTAQRGKTLPWPGKKFYPEFNGSVAALPLPGIRFGQQWSL
jgi:hypothetical protein